MRVLTINGLMRLTQTELCGLAARIGAELHKRCEALAKQRRKRAAITEPHAAAEPGTKRGRLSFGGLGFSNG